MRFRPIGPLVLCLLPAFFLLAYPLYVIRPFRYQGARELAAALAILRFRQGVEIVLGVFALLVLMAGWRQAKAIPRIAMACLALLVLTCVLLSHINVYEKMFHPLEQPTFTAAGSARLEADEQVIAVRIGTAARAYPLRGMSYHHIVNDTLGDRAIVATY